ncbi:hypothetical protein EDB84DRAFT_1434173 [Lactarius hengduanensis]|nr:hypothetical protein EDB84DRAFT_1434173 [Lactarius hengduanensis]
MLRFLNSSLASTLPSYAPLRVTKSDSESSLLCWTLAVAQLGSRTSYRLSGSPNTHAGLCVLDPRQTGFSVMRIIAFALVVKVALTAVTFGIKVSAENDQCVIPGLYAMVGAAAALSSVTRFAASITMLGVLIAKTAAYALEPKGIFELVIIERVCFWY